MLKYEISKSQTEPVKVQEESPLDAAPFIEVIKTSPEKPKAVVKKPT